MHEETDQAFATDSTPQPIAHRTLAWLFGAYALAVAFRNPVFALEPRFWAEEGNVYFRYALDHGTLETLFARHIGYYALVPNVATWLATFLPLPFAPFATLSVSLVIQCIPAWLVLEDRELWPTIPSKALALLVLLLPFTTKEVWLSTIHAQFWLAIAVSLSLVVPPASRASLVLRAVMVAIAATTGPVSVILAPLFVWVAVRSRDRRVGVEGAILCAGAIFMALSIHGERPIAWPADELVSVLVSKLLLVPVLGKRAGGAALALFDHARGLWALPVAAAFLGLLGLFYRALSRKGRVLLAAATFVGVVGIIGALGDHRALTTGGGRYGFVPNVVFALLLAGAATTWARARLLARILLAAVLVTGAFKVLPIAKNVRSFGSAYRTDARLHALDPGLSIRTMGPKCRILPSADRIRRGFSVSAPRIDGDRVELDVSVSPYDVGHQGAFFVLGMSHDSNAPIQVLTPLGLHDAPVFFFGGVPPTEPGSCYGGGREGADLAPFRSGRLGPTVLSIPLAALSAMHPGSVLHVGYGRDIGDALAKGTFAALEVPRR